MRKELHIEFAEACTKLRASNPLAWKTFNELLVKRQEEVLATLLNAPVDTLAQHQGRAVEARTLISDLAQAIADGEKLKGR
jgi:hypothetical protein